MKFDSVIKYLDQHGIDYDKKLTVAINDGCHEDYQNLWNNILEDVENDIRYGVNNGFSGDMKDNISKLTKLLVKIHGEQNGKKVAKFTVEREKIQKECEKMMKNQSNVNIKAEVIKYVDTYIEGTQLSIDLKRSKLYVDVLQSGVEKLNELKTALEDVVDFTTTDALAVAKNIIASLKSWAHSVFTIQYNTSSLSYIDQALDQAKKWTELRGGVKKGLFVKDNSVKNIDEIAFNLATEEIYQLIYSSKIKLRLDDFNARINEMKEFTKESNSEENTIDTLLADLKKQEEKKIQLNNEIDNLMMQNENGQISDIECDIRCTQSERALDYIEQDIIGLKQELNDLISEMNNDATRSQRTMYTKLETIIKAMLKYGNNPRMLAYLGTQVNFDSLHNVLNGLSTEQDIRNVLDLHANIKTLEIKWAEKNQEFIEKLKEQEEKNRERLAQQTHSNQQPLVDENTAMQERMNARRARRQQVSTVTNPGQPINTQANTNGNNTNENNLNFIFTEEDK